MGKGSSGHFHGTSGERGLTDLGGLFSGSGSIHSYPTTLHEGQQGKHMPTHNNYVKGRSIFYGSMEDARILIRDFAGTGTWHEKSRREAVDFGKVIGRYVNVKTGESRPTTRGTIHYSKKGAHIVPASPR